MRMTLLFSTLLLATICNADGQGSLMVISSPNGEDEKNEVEEGTVLMIFPVVLGQENLIAKFCDIATMKEVICGPVSGTTLVYCHKVDCRTYR